MEPCMSLLTLHERETLEPLLRKFITPLGLKQIGIFVALPDSNISRPMTRSVCVVQLLNYLSSCGAVERSLTEEKLFAGSCSGQSGASHASRSRTRHAGR